MGDHVAKAYDFDELEEAPLIVDCVYRSGYAPNLRREVIRKLFGSIANMGGFRYVMRQDPSGNKEKLPAFVVLVTSNREPEWPDFLDPETGIFHYYGDNRKAGTALAETPGNRLLEKVFKMLHDGRWRDIPPFFIFRQTGRNRDVQFLGLAAPGNPKLSSDHDLVAFWRTMGEIRFQNYEAYFTILDTGSDPINKNWLQELRTNHAGSSALAPKAWREFLHSGREGIRALKAPKIQKIPTKEEQIGFDAGEGRRSLLAIHDYFAKTKNFCGFEACAANLVAMMDPNFDSFILTRPWRDGGRDAIGHYKIGKGTSNPALKIDFALEAKCYGLNQSVGVHEMSRLISRIRYRQFGIMVTTSYVNSQAYEEVVQDGHPILIITARDIERILREHSIRANDVENWIQSSIKRYEGSREK